VSWATFGGSFTVAGVSTDAEFPVLKSVELAEKQRLHTRVMRIDKNTKQLNEQWTYIYSRDLFCEQARILREK
jgi:hypothetical protein